MSDIGVTVTELLLLMSLSAPEIICSRSLRKTIDSFQ